MVTTDAAPESELIRTVADREAYDSFRPFLRDYVTLPEAWAVIEDIGEWYKANPSATALDWASFHNFTRITLHSVWKPDKWLVYDAIVNTAKALTAPNPNIVDRFRELDAAAQIRAKADEALAKGGTNALDALPAILDTYTKHQTRIQGDELVTDDLEELLDTTVRKGGVEWRLEDMNRAGGPLHPGDLVIVGARPNVGKTTFLASEITYMVPQLPEGKGGLIVNNEERGEKVKLRCVQAMLDMSLNDITADPAAAAAAYKAALNGRRIDVISRPSLSVSDVERLCRKGTYGFIGINVLDKLYGFNKLEGVERSRRLALWARELADTHGIVFALSQADASAEGKRTLDQSQLYGSKTGVQGEADLQLMIGKENNPAQAEVRWINVAKSKMPFGPRVIPGLSHGQFEVKIDLARGQYHSITYKTRAP